jgi:hypothetical protein
MPKYWYAYSKTPENWMIIDWGRWSYPVTWQGRVFILAGVLFPIALTLLLLPVFMALPDWGIAALLLAVVCSSTLGLIAIMRAKTDPHHTIEDYREGRAGVGNRPTDA